MRISQYPRYYCYCYFVKVLLMMMLIVVVAAVVGTVAVDDVVVWEWSLWRF